MKKTLIKVTQLFAVFVIALSATSCLTPKNLYRWYNYSGKYYLYLKDADEKSFDELMKTYQKIFQDQRKSVRKTVPPGIYADYAYILLENGEIDEAKEMFEKEIELYPESEVFIRRILAKLEETRTEQ